MSEISDHTGNLSEQPKWTLPTSQDDISGMIRIQQRVFRETNAFPTHSPLGNEQRQALISELPPINEPNSLQTRFEIFARGDMLTLDLNRIENEGDWQTGAELDKDVENFLRELCAHDGMQRELGVIALGGVIAKDSLEAKPTSHATSLGEELNRQGVFLVTRHRRVARFAIHKTGDVFVVRKRSDFALRVHITENERLYLRASALANGGPHIGFAATYGYSMEQMSEMHQQLRHGFNTDIEAGIRTRSPYLKPFGMGYHAAVRERSADDALGD